jgi:hypothetical protein
MSVIFILEHCILDCFASVGHSARLSCCLLVVLRRLVYVALVLQYIACNMQHDHILLQLISCTMYNVLQHHAFLFLYYCKPLR